VLAGRLCVSFVSDAMCATVTLASEYILVVHIAAWLPVDLSSPSSTFDYDIPG